MEQATGGGLCARGTRSCTMTIDARSVSLATSAAAAAACDAPFKKQKRWCFGEKVGLLRGTARCAPVARDAYRLTK
jgi:hypothetical protein